MGARGEANDSAIGYRAGPGKCLPQEVGVNPIWLPASLLGGLFQAWRKALQQRLRAEHIVSGAGLVRYLYGLPFALLFAMSWFSLHGDSRPLLNPAFFALSAIGGVTLMAC